MIPDGDRNLIDTMAKALRYVIRRKPRSFDRIEIVTYQHEIKPACYRLAAESLDMVISVGEHKGSVLVQYMLRAGAPAAYEAEADALLAAAGGLYRSPRAIDFDEN
jgi:hypothetical protein